MTRSRVRLGDITLPAGVVAVYDVGVVAFVLSGQIPELPLVRVAGLPTDRLLEVWGVRSADDCGWDHVALHVSDGGVARRVHVGDVVVDFARIIFIDDEARGAWRHDDAIDGLADVVFWGRDAAALAEVVKAPALPADPGTYGWTNLAVDDAVSHGQRLESEKQARGFKLAWDFRPHSHHFQALEALRQNPCEAGVVDVGGARALLWMTSWGDGVFPVYTDLDGDGALLQVRVQLCADEVGH
jgi:hypothetical protein